MINMKYKIIAYASSVVAAIALCITALLGFKLINYKSVMENSGEDSVVVVKAINEKKELILERSYFDVLGKNLLSVIENDKDFDINSTGFVEGIKGIKPDSNKSFWSLTSSIHDECKSNEAQSCNLGAPYIYLSNVNEFTFKYTTANGILNA